MNLSHRQLKAFLEVARLHSFTRAAENLHITQQGLSLMIRELEAQFSCRLFDRTTRSVSLTSAGRMLVPVAEQTVSSVEAVAASIGELSLQARRSLTVAATPLVAAALMPEVYAAFRERHPDVTVRILDVERRYVQAMVETGEADVGFGVFFKPAASLKRRQIFRCDLVCASPEGRDGSARRVGAPAQLAWRDLADRPLIALPADNPLQQLVDSQLALLGRGNEERAQYNHFQTMLSMVEAGQGSAILPSFIIAAARRMAIRVERLSDPVVPINFFQINLKGRAPASAEADFVAILLQIMRTRCRLGA